MVSMKSSMFQFIKMGVYALSACSILTLASCSNNVATDEPLPQAVNTGKSVSIDIKAEAELDESARALVYTLSADGGFQNSLEGTTQTMWTIIRSTDASKPMYSANLEWKIKPGNKLVLDAKVSIPWEVYDAMHTGDWFASCVLSSVTTNYGNQSFSGPTSSSQRFGYDGATQRLYPYTPSDGLIGEASHYTGGFDYSGPIASGTKASALPALYILPWTKISTVGPKRIGLVGSEADTFTTSPTRSITFSGQLKPIGTVVRINLQTQPATYTMLDQTQSTAGIKSYVDKSPWGVDELKVSAKVNGYYNFASTTIKAGNIPPFVHTEGTAKEVRFFLKDKSLTFNSPATNLGYVYFWTPAQDAVGVSVTLDHPYRYIASLINRGYSSYTSGLTEYGVFNYTGSTRGRRPITLMPTPDSRGSISFAEHFTLENKTMKVINLPYLPEGGDVAAWETLFKSGVYAFDCAYEYPMKSISVKNGYTKEVIITVKPELKNIQRSSVSTYWSY